jgi:hypothetical protein
VRRLFYLPIVLALLAALAATAASGPLAATSSGADGDIVFARGGQLWVRSAANGTVTPLPPASASDPSWRPDGAGLAFVQSGSIATCTIPACTSAAVLRAGSEPVWSPDGTKIAYVAGGTVSTMVAADGSSPQTLTPGDHPSWSPDGHTLVYDLGGQLHAYDVSTSTASAALAIGGLGGSPSQPAWSPDGTQIAFQASDGAHVQIWVVAAAGGTATKVTSSAADKSAPSWAPNGQAIVFARSDGIFSATQSGSGWTESTALDSGSGDATPDWQTAVPVNVTPPTITGSGSPVTGDLLSAANGSWQGADAAGFTYQWQRCDTAGGGCADIAGETAQTHAVVAGDVGGTLRVQVTASNVAGESGPAASAVTGVVALAGTVTPPANTGVPTVAVLGVDQSVFVGRTAAATVGSWTGSFPLSYAYQWTWCPAEDPLNGPCYPIPDATSSRYVIPPEYYGYRLRIRITASNAAGSAQISSAATDVVSALAPRLRQTPPLGGTPVVGLPVTIGAGVWDGQPRPTIAYEWRRCDSQGAPESCVAIPGATSNSYTPVSEDIGAALRVWLTGTNQAGSDTEYTNHTYPVVDRAHLSPTATAAPSTGNMPQLGLPFAASEGVYDGDAPIATALQWQRCDATGAACGDIAGATSATYTPRDPDVGWRLRVAVTASNAYGTLVALSAPSEPVPGSYPHHAGKHIGGTSGNDYLIGTPWDDVLLGGAGNDTLDGGAGYDRLVGGAGNDVITVGAPGGSTVEAGPGSDTVYAANGVRDTIDCGSGRDRAIVDAFDVVKNCEVVDRPAAGG